MIKAVNKKIPDAISLEKGLEYRVRPCFFSAMVFLRLTGNEFPCRKPSVSRHFAECTHQRCWRLFLCKKNMMMLKYRDNITVSWPSTMSPEIDATESDVACLNSRRHRHRHRHSVKTSWRHAGTGHKGFAVCGDNP